MSSQPDTLLKHHPALRTSAGRERRAAWIELFFDLVFVLAVAELAQYLRLHLTPGGILGYIGLFIPVWWTWTCFTFYADQFDPDDIAYRLIMLVAMLLSIILAVTVPSALQGSTTPFVVVYIVLQAVVVGLYVWACRDENARWFSMRFAVGLAAGAGLWLVSLLFPAPLRYALWAVALVIELGVPLLVSLSLPKQFYYASHIPERLGLFTLIVLGESIVVVGTGIAGTRWQPSSVATALGGFVAVACLWWLYFDRIDVAVIERAMTGSKWEVVRSYTWSYLHAALFAALTLASVGIELAIADAAHTFESGARAALCGGVAASLGAITLVQRLGPRALSRMELIGRGIAIVAALGLWWLASPIGTPGAVALLALALVVATVFEVRAVRSATGTPGTVTPKVNRD